MKAKLTNVALRTSLLYAIAGVLWILFSDQMLVSKLSDPAAVNRLQTYKGWAFVTVTAVLLYFALRGQLSLWEKEAAARRLADEALRHSEERFQLAMRGANDGLWDCDLRTNEVYYSPRWKSMLGYADDEVENSMEAWERLVHPQDLERTLVQRQDLMDARSDKYEVEFRLRHKDGHYLNILSRGFPLRDAEGRCVRVVGTHVDITERKRAEAALRQSEERFAKAFRASPAALSITRLADGCFIDVNEAFLQLAGYGRAELIGRRSTVLNLFPDPALRAELVRLLREQGTVRNFELSLRTKTGDLRRVLLSAEEIELDGDPHILAILVDITERQRAEEELRRSKSQLVTALEAGRMGMWIMDFNQNTAWWDEEAAKVCGITLEQAGGGRLEAAFSFVHPADRSRVQEEVEAAVKEGRDLAIEYRVLRPDGSVACVASRGRVERDAGLPSRLTGVTMDITERRRAETALRQSEERFAKAFRASPAALSITRLADGCFVDVNEAFLLLSGYGRAELIGRRSTDLNMFTDPDLRAELVRRLREQGTVRNYEMPLRIKSGDLRRVLFSTEEIELGGDPHVLAILVDITDRKRAEEELRSSRSQLLTALEAGRMGTWIIDLKKNIMWWDDETVKALGVPPLDEAGTPLDIAYSLVHPEDLHRVQATMEAAIREGSPATTEYRVVRPDGGVVWAAVRGQLERDPAGLPARLTGVIMDISARKRAEETQLRSQKLEALGTLAGGIAHDFNNILVAINGNTELAIAYLPPSHPAQESLREITKAGARATDLVRRILTFSRPVEHKREVVQLRPAVEEALRLVRATLPAMTDIHSDFASNVPTIEADSSQIHQIIVNLATNAAHAIGSRRGVIEVRLDAENVDAEHAAVSPDLHEGRYARLTVSDNGCGMDKPTLERIFDPFFTTKAPGLGTGLGLSVVHGIMQSHEGAVTVYSQPGKGSTFRLYFPASRDEAGRHPAPSHETTHGQGERVLYVDDEEALVRLSTRMLKRLGYEVTGHSDPVAALQDFRSRPQDFDVIVTDASMPRMSGLELARELLAARPDVPILMTSGYLRPEDHEAALQMGVRGLIMKPNTIEELSRAFDRLFRDRESRDKQAVVE